MPDQYGGYTPNEIAANSAVTAKNNAANANNVGSPTAKDTIGTANGQSFFVGGTPQAPSANAVENKPTATYPVMTADNALKDLNTKQGTLNNIQQGMALQQGNNAVTAANKTATDQNQAAIDAAGQPSKTLSDIKDMVSGTTQDTTTANPDKTTPAEQETGLTYEDIQKQIDEATTNFNTSLASLQTGSFPLTPVQQAQINSTQKLYENMTNQIRSSYSATLGGTNVLNTRLGLDQYAPQTALGNIQEIMNEMQSKITDTEVQAAKAVTDLQSAFETDNYNKINDSYTKLTANLDRKSNLLNSLNDQINKQATLTLQQHQSDMADAKAEYDKQQAAINFAVTNNITKPFYLVGNTAVNASTGEKVDLPTYLKLTGQDPTLQEGDPNIDWSKLQTDIQTPEERTLAQNQSQFDASQELAHEQLAQNESQFEATQAAGGQYTLGSGDVRYDAQGNEIASNSGSSSDMSTLQPYLNTSYNGTPYVDLSSLSPKDKAQYAQVAATNGYKAILNSADAAKLNAIADANTNLQNIRDSLSKFSLADGTFTGGLPGMHGISNSISGFLGDADIKSYNAWRTAIINNVQALAGGAGSGLRINEKEINLALQNDLPTITGTNADTYASAKAKLDNLTGQLNNWEKQLVGGGNTAPGVSAGGQVIEYPPGSGKQYQADAGGNFDPNKPLTNGGSVPSNAQGNQVKGIAVKAAPLKPITTVNKPVAPISKGSYTPAQNTNLKAAIAIPSNLTVKIGTGAAVKNNNPGNLRNTDGSWQHFATPQEGFSALTGYLERAKTGQHAAYNGNQSLYDFFSHYAPAADKNNPKSYAESVAKQLGVSPTTKISSLNTLAWAKAIAKHESGTSFS